MKKAVEKCKVKQGVALDIVMYICNSSLLRTEELPKIEHIDSREYLWKS